MVKFISVHSCKCGCKEQFVDALISKQIGVLDVGLESDSREYLSSQSEKTYPEWIIHQTKNNPDFENVIVIFQDLFKDSVDLDNCEGYFIQLTDSDFHEEHSKFDCTINTYNQNDINDKIDILIK